LKNIGPIVVLLKYLLKLHVLHLGRRRKKKRSIPDRNVPRPPTEGKKERRKQPCALILSPAMHVLPIAKRGKKKKDPAILLRGREPGRGRGKMGAT